MMEKEKKEELPIVVSWVGSTDIQRMKKWLNYEFLKDKSPEEREKYEIQFKESRTSPEPEEKNKNGPIRTITDDKKTQKIYLLCSKEFSKYKDDIAVWVKRGNESPVHVIETEVNDPTSYEEILNALVKFHDDYFDEKKPSLYYFNITPGTPAMQAMTLFLAGSRFIGSKFYATRDPRYASKDSLYYYPVHVPYTLPSALTAPTASTSTTIDYDIRQDILTHYAVYPSITILLTGESGVGKTEFAKEIHNARNDDPDKFVYVNCAEIATDPSTFSVELFGANKGAYTGLTSNRTGKFELAQDGTLFLDEIGEIPFSMQSILLNAIQNKEIRKFNDNKIIKLKNVRIISATNKDLIKAVEKGEFREDLYYRIAMCCVPLKPLREIAATDETSFKKLLDDTLENIVKEIPDFKDYAKVDDVAYEFIKNQNWPGNLRQFHHVLLLSCVDAVQSKAGKITKAVIEKQLSRMIMPSSKVEEVRPSEDPDFIPSNLEEWLLNKKIEFVKKALTKAKDNVSTAKDILGCDYQNLNNFVKKHGLK